MFTAFALALGQMADPRVLRIWLKSLLATLVVFAVLGVAGWWLLDRTLAWAGLSEANLAAPEGLRGLIAALGVILGAIVLWRIVALAVLQLFADEVVAAVEARHYPAAAARARALGWHDELANALRGAGRALALNALAAPVALLLLVTGIGAAAVFTLVNALLLGRELQDMVWLRHRTDRQAPDPLKGYERFMLGLVVAVLLLVPFVNFLAPFLGAAAAAHLIHRKDLKSHVA